MDERDKGYSVVQKKFKHKTLVNDPKTIQSLVKKVPDSQFENVDKGPLTLDSIRIIVNNYNVTGEGIGVVAIANEMHKVNISVTGFVVIFDLKTKELLYVISAMGKAGDKGTFARFYSKGIAEIMGLFYKADVE